MVKHITSAEFDEQLAAHGMRVVRPGDPDFVTWGHVDVGGGVLIDRWRGGGTLSTQLSYLLLMREAAKSMPSVNAAPPPAAAKPDAKKDKSKKPIKKGAKNNGKAK